MIYNPKQFGAKLNNLFVAWAQYAPEGKLGGMSLAEFKAATVNSGATRQQLDQLRMQVRGLVAQRHNADEVAQALFQRVVAGVLADPDHGPDSAFYRALHYVTKSERASGLKRSTETSVSSSSSTSTSAATSGSTAGTVVSVPSTTTASTANTTTISSIPSTN